jgi:TPR repeat protein
VEKDIDEGIRWLSLSAKNGNQQAAKYLNTQANN